MSINTLFTQSLSRFHQTVIMSWVVVIAMSIVARAEFSAPRVSMIEVAGWLMLACVPPIVLLSVFRGAPRTMAQVIDETEHLAAPARAPATARK